MDEDQLQNAVDGALQEALSFGVNRDVFMRLARTVSKASSSKRPMPSLDDVDDVVCRLFSSFDDSCDKLTLHEVHQVVAAVWEGQQQ